MSIENDFITPKNICGIDNNRIAYITKQYITLLKAKEILQEIIINKKNGEISDPCSLIFPLESILGDLNSGNPFPTTIAIFGENKKTTFDHNGVQILVPETILGDYNHFLCHEYADKNGRIEKAKQLIEKLNIACNKALTILLDNCNGTAKTHGEIKSKQIEELLP
jgi:hypothetical protein